MPSKAGGCAANVAIDLAKQGFAVDVCGCVGADASAEVLLQSLSAAGVGCGQVRRLDSHPTSKTVILLVEGEDRRYIHVFGANAAFDIGRIRRDMDRRPEGVLSGGLFVMPAVARRNWPNCWPIAAAAASAPSSTSSCRTIIRA